MSSIPLDKDIFQSTGKLSFPYKAAGGQEEVVHVDVRKRRQVRTLSNGNKLIVEFKPIRGETWLVKIQSALGAQQPAY